MFLAKPVGPGAPQVMPRSAPRGAVDISLGSDSGVQAIEQFFINPNL